MHLSDHSLSQLDEAYVQTLDEGLLRGLLLRALEDLKEARERLRQNPTNSSRPPSSQAPWDRPSASQDETRDDDETSPPDPEVDQPDEAGTSPEDPSTQSAQTSKPETPKRKPGKQPGAPGFGRTQVFEAHETRIYRPEVCAGCGTALLRPGWLGLTDRLRLPAQLCALIILYFFAIHFIGAPYPRYGIPLRPLVYGFGIFTVAAAPGAIQSRLRGRAR